MASALALCPVIGYDEKKRSIIVHFSDLPNEAVSLATFAALWKRSSNWGVVLLPPGELPVSVSSKIFLRAVYELKKQGKSRKLLHPIKAHWSVGRKIRIFFSL